MFDAAAYLQQTRRHGSSRSRWQLRGQVQELPPGRAGQTVQTQVLSRLVLRVVFQAQILNSTQLDESTATTTTQTKASPSAKKGKILFFGSKCSLKEKYSCPEAAAESKIGHWICLVSVRDVLIRARNEFSSFYYIPHNMILLKGTQNKLSSKIIIISPLPGGKSIGNQSDNICITSMTSAIVNTWRNKNSKMRAAGCRFTLVTKQMTRNLFNNYLHCHYGPQQVKY